MRITVCDVVYNRYGTVRGSRIKLPAPFDKHDFLLHPDISKQGGWTVTEISSGGAIVMGCQKDEAKNIAYQCLKGHGYDAFSEKVQENAMIKGSGR